MRSGNYFTDTGVDAKISLTALTANNPAQLWRIVETASGSGTYYLTSKNGRSIYFNLNLGVLNNGAKGDSFTFVRSKNATYIDNWEINWIFNGIGGGSVSNMTGNELTINAPDDAGNPVVFTYVETTTLGVKNTNYSNKVVLYPNPAKNTVAIKLPTAIATSVEITNLLGQTVSRSSYNATDLINVNLAGATNGLYFVKVTNNEIHEVSKLVITN